MTIRNTDKKIGVKQKAVLSGSSFIFHFISILFTVLIIIFAFVLSSEASEYVIQGLTLSIECVIPAAFPFLIITELYTKYGAPERLRPIARLFKKTFGISEIGLRAFLCGNICGFPMGAKMSAELYSSNKITKWEAERLAALSNNPSLAFILGAVGPKMFHDKRIGYIYVFSIFLSTALVGIILRGKTKITENSSYIFEQKFSLVESISSAGLACVNICAFVTAFSVLVGLINSHILVMPLKLILISLSEVTGAVVFFSGMYLKYPFFSTCMGAFCLGFGGLSVLMQSAYFSKKTDISLFRYFLIKLLHGLLCAIICYIFVLVLK